MKKFLSSVLLLALTLAWVPSSFAALQDVGTGFTAAGGNSGFNFDNAADQILAVPNAVDIGTTGSDSIASAHANIGTAAFAGSSNVAGDVGINGGFAIKAIQLNDGSTGTVAFSGNVASLGLAFGTGASADAIVTLANNKNMTIGASGITTFTNNKGTLTSLGTNTIAGAVGTNPNKLKTVNGGVTGNTTTFSNDVFATTTNVTGTGTLTLNGNLTGTTLDFNAAGATGAVNLADTKTLTAAVTTQTTDTGKVNFVGGGTMAGDLGTTSKLLKLVTIDSGANGSKTVSTNGNIYATTVNFGADSTLTLTADKDITAAITATAGQGTLNLNGTTVVTGVVGGTGALRVINAGANGKTDTFANNVTSQTLNVTGTGTVALNGNLTSATALNFNTGATTGTVALASGHTITGAVTNSTANQGILTLGSGSSVTGAVGSAGVGLNTVNLNGGDATTGGNTKAVNFSLGANTLGVTGTFQRQTTAGTISTTINSASTFGKITSTGAATIDNTTTVATTVTGYVANGTALKIVNGTGGSAVGTVAGITDNSVLLNFTQDTSNTEDLVIVANRVNVATSGNNSTVSDALANVTNPTADFTSILNTIDTYTTANDVNTAYSEMHPVVNAGATTASFDAANGAMGALAKHSAEVRGASAGETGIAAGGIWKDSAIWAKGFGDYAKQSTRSGIPGFDSWTLGTALGIDGLVTDDLRLGIGGGYAYSNVDGKGVSNDNTNVDNYQGTIYANWNQEPWYVDAAFSFGWNDYTATRDIAFAGRQAKGDYSGQQYTTYFETGYGFEEQGYKITPTASLQWVHLDLDKYTETGADSLDLSVNSQSYDVLQSGLGLGVAYPMTIDWGTLTPEIHGKWLYDFIGDKVESTSTFTGGGASFKTTGYSPAQNSFDIGAELKLATKGNWTVSADYDFNVKSDYYSHNGVITARYAY